MRIFLICMVVIMAIEVQAAEHGKWNSFVASHVKNGLVDYKSAAINENLLDEYLEQIAVTDFHSLGDSDRLAYLINAYNAHTVALILAHSDGKEMVDSIKDIGGFFSSPWKKKIARLGGTLYSLDEIEHTLIRSQFSDPRVHFALNCASISCPPLAPYAYEGESLETQLNRQTESFINTVENTYLKNRVLYVSKIFDWYEDDFTSGVLSFIKGYAKGDLAVQLSTTEKISLSHMSYDWSLNILQE